MHRPDPGRWRSLLVALPALSALVLVLAGGVPDTASSALLLALVLVLTCAVPLWQRPFPGHWLRNLSNLVEALREGDYSMRGVASGRNRDYAALVRSLNELAVHLQDERRGLQESLQLLSKTLAGLDSAVFAFEAGDRLRLINPAGERLLARSAAEVLGRDAAELNLDVLLALPSDGIHAHAFPGQSGRWQISHAALRSRSQAGHLLVVQPIERALRREESQAFQRLLRVLGHEINNSMAPIVSMADTLQRLLPEAGRPLSAETRADLESGLVLIGQRGAALQRFLQGYTRLARLPAPKPGPVSLLAVTTHVCGLLDDDRVWLEGSADLGVRADRDQLEQVLINLLRNALEAGEEQGRVAVRWRGERGRARIEILDDGHGLPASGNLFVPFFTTKPDGSGIGLALSRQIMEAQQGSLELLPREDGQGAVAVIELPLAEAEPERRPDMGSR